MILWALLPMLSFLALLLVEKKLPGRSIESAYTSADWVMNLSGFFMQGVVVPLLGYLLATGVYPRLLPNFHGCLPLGFIGAFALNLVFIDFLYYLQHRAFHQIPWLWKMHAPHHHSKTVNVWATSRNSILTNLLFVYMLINPVLGYLCNVPEGFFAGAMVTAALDLFRHANTRLTIPFLREFMLMPPDHHRHHDAEKPFANYGANFLLWDKLFGTFDTRNELPTSYAVPNPPPLPTQLLYPWRS